MTKREWITEGQKSYLSIFMKYCYYIKIHYVNY